MILDLISISSNGGGWIYKRWSKLVSNYSTSPVTVASNERTVIVK